MAQHLVSAGFPKLEIIQIGKLGLPKVLPVWHAKTWWGCT